MKNRNCLFSFIMYASLVSGLLTFASCGGSGGGGGSSTVTPLGVSHRGYYTGTAEVSEAGSPVTYTMQAIADHDEFVMTDVLANPSTPLVYRVKFTSISGTSFKADVRTYRLGLLVDTGTISNGAIVTAANGDKSLTGTIVGTDSVDYASASFNITYNTINSRTPVNYLLDTGVWGAVDGLFRFTAEGTGHARLALKFIPNDLSDCESTSVPVSNVETEQPGRVRSMKPFVLETCFVTPSLVGTEFTAYFTNFDDADVDDRLFFIFFNNDYAFAMTETCNQGTGACFAP